ncbi:hypothetical protein I7I48_03597 [Histoplasma ohiense]|nr:hypothetical protein I7I48_03597 [Histoplasma ohiense (nom. inval.)]
MPSQPTAIIFPLADSVRSLLADADMSKALVGLMRPCEILWKSPFPRKRMVFKCDGNIVRIGSVLRRRRLLTSLQPSPQTPPRGVPVGCVRNLRSARIWLS